MNKCQANSLSADSLSLQTERLGPLPIINHFIERLDLDAVFERFVPTADRRVKLPYSKGLGVLLRSILVEREPIYRQQELVSTYNSRAFGLPRNNSAVGDDAIGRCLDRFFDSDRGAIMTELVVAATRVFGLKSDELHNDSTSIKFSGQYRKAKGRSIRGKKAPFITHGYSKDHRPDLKQLLFILTTNADGGVPMQFRIESGNTTDSRTHEQTWETLCQVTGKPDFLYVADSKLCSTDTLRHISFNGGRFVCVIPRNRHEDPEFRKWIQTRKPNWELAWDRPHPRGKDLPNDQWWVYRHEIPSLEGWPVIWVKSNLLKLKQTNGRRLRIAKTIELMEQYNAKLAGPRPRKKSAREIYDDIDQLLKKHRVSKYLSYSVEKKEKHSFKQSTPGRPTAKTRYVRKTKKYFRLQWRTVESAIEYDQKSDGMYPLLTNDRDLSPVEVLRAHKRQPTIEKRFEQTKTVYSIAPVLLKNEGRIEALFCLYFVALMIQSLIEREVRKNMKTQGIDWLPLYPEERKNRRPTCEQIFRLFASTERHVLSCHSKPIKVFNPKLTELQLQILDLLGIKASAYDFQKNSAK